MRPEEGVVVGVVDGVVDVVLVDESPVDPPPVPSVLPVGESGLLG